MVCILHSVPIALVGRGHLLKQFNEMLSQYQEAHGVKCLVICDFFSLKKSKHSEHEAVRVWGVGITFRFILGHVNIQTRSVHEYGTDNNWRLLISHQ